MNGPIDLSFMVVSMNVVPSGRRVLAHGRSVIGILSMTVLLTGCSELPGKQPEPPGPAPHPPVSGRCIVISNEHDVVLENAEIGPCEGPGITVYRSKNVTIQNVTVRNTTGVGIFIKDAQKVIVKGSRFVNNSSGVYAVNSKNVTVAHNTFSNVKGPKPRGQFVQFNGVSGESRISCNIGRNEPGKSNPEDAISLFKSAGTDQSPILVDHNVIIGGGPSTSGGGIMLGDAGGAHITASDNQVVDPGQYGIAVSGGTDMVIERNVVLAKSQSFTNVGIYVWNQSKGACGDVRVKGNRVNWLNRHGKRNSWWDGGNCGQIGVDGNDFQTQIPSENEIRKLPSYCGPGSS